MVQKKIKTILWSEHAEQHYYEILGYLSEEAPEALEIVGNALLDMIESLDREYQLHPEDRFKRNNDGTFRVAVVFSYRISYQVDASTINILRIRHTSREPLNFEIK